MKKSIYSMPEEFGMSPLYMILPQEGDVKSLISENTSLYARLERIKDLRQGVEGEEQSKLILEESMLQIVLGWISQGQNIVGN